MFTGITVFEEIKKRLLGSTDDRKSIADFEAYLRRNIFNKDVTLIPKYNTDVLEIKLGTEDQRPVYDLGDGLQSLIIILFPLFIAQGTTKIVLIEEPETHLHPKWQRKLLECMSRMDKVTFFISTHSSSFINRDDLSVFAISQISGKTHIRACNYSEDKRDILDRLGYKPSDLLLSNYVLWVEGCLLYTSPSPRDRTRSRMPSSA